MEAVQASADHDAIGGLGQFIGGKLRDGGDARFELIDPANEAVLANPAGASSADVAEALDLAVSGMAQWQAMTPQARSRVLAQGAANLRRRAAEVALVLSMEQGKPLDQAAVEVELSAETLDWYAGETLRIEGRILPARTSATWQTVTPRAIGVVACFTPWNFPLLLSARKLGPALAAGCACILKPAEETPASPLALVQCLHEAGVPEGALSVVYGNAPRISGELIAHPAVRAITFTGSTEVGRIVARDAAQWLKPCTLELGGHAPVIVLEDIDVPSAVVAAVAGKTRNSGQVCTSPSRFFVARAVYDEFAQAFAKAMSALPIGGGREAGVQMGPLANGRRVEAAEQLVADARAKGARVLSGGARQGNRGFLFQPTVLADVPADADIMQVEPFCPVAALAPFDSIDDAIARANSTRAGLAGYVFSRDFAAARDVAARLDVGQVGINSFAVSHVEAPFGGVRESGYGVEGGREAVEAFLARQYIHHVRA